jgi:phage gpG-like protein
MALVRLQIGLEGDRQANELLFTRKKNVEDFRPVWADIRNFLMQVMREQFDTEGARAAKWQPLSKTYAAWKSRNYPGKTILRRTDRLFNSLTTLGAPDQVFESDKLSMIFGTRVPYAAKHQLGEGRVPQRRILSLTVKDRLAIRNLVREHIAKGPL